MILIGQFDSPFTRRVGICLTHYGVAFEHRPWSVMGMPARSGRSIRCCACRPSCATMAPSWWRHWLSSILQIPSRPRQGADFGRQPERSAVLRICGFASGISDAAVSLFYELRLHAETSAMLVERRRGQIRDTLALLEAEAPEGGFCLVPG